MNVSLTPAEAGQVRALLRRQRALEELEEAVGHYLHRHAAPDLRAAYIEAREAKHMSDKDQTVDQALAQAREELASQVPEVQDILEKTK